MVEKHQLLAGRSRPPPGLPSTPLGRAAGESPGENRRWYNERVLRKLVLDGTGPAKHIAAEFANRVNLITGDNGLGKSFLLDVAWWALTRTWPGPNRMALPREDSRSPRITVSTTSKTKAVERIAKFDFKRQEWVQQKGRPPMPGLVIYAQVDGSFAVWDPARNYWTEGRERPSAFLFDSHQVWTGLQEDGQWRCNGLYRDWASWQREENGAFHQLKLALEKLSPPDEPLVPGKLRRISPSDSLDYPSIRMPYGMDVPVVHASAAIRRIVALSYLLIWAWQEHRQAAAQRREPPASRIVFVVDEIEAHLHPRWQRRVLPCLLQAVEALTVTGEKPAVQLLATTHSPLVCVSLEPLFDEDQDRTFTLELDGDQQVCLDSLPFVKQGTIQNWLHSEQMGGVSERSEESEAAIKAAGELSGRDMRQPGSVKPEEFRKVDKALRGLLPDIDPFWVVWRRVAERRGWTQ